MEPRILEDLLKSVRTGELSVEAAMSRLRRLPFESTEFAHVDHHRSLRCGFPEVIYCEGKTTSQAAVIFSRLAGSGGPVLATRATKDHWEAIHRVAPAAQYHESARCVSLRQGETDKTEGLIALVAAGTSDLPVLEEARVTCELFGQRTWVLADVGVSGLHRLLAHLETLQTARVIIAAAGMDGAMPGVLKGLVRAPVVALPTSVGYGAHFGGIAPLLTMLNACSPGVAVVNIDNGFAAGYLASIINRIGEHASR